MRVSDDYLNQVLEYLMNYKNRVSGDIVTSALAIFRTYDREIAVLYDIGYEPYQMASYLMKYLIFKPQRSDNYLTTVPNNAKGWERITRMKRQGLKLRLRGRGTNRKARVNAVGKTLNHSHDLPLNLSDSIAIYKR